MKQIVLLSDTHHTLDNRFFSHFKEADEIWHAGDVGTIEKHLLGLLDRAPELLPVYCEMALIGLPYAFEKGNLSQEKLQEIRELLVSFKNKRGLKCD